MVKFGRHLQFYLESDDTHGPRDDPYIGKCVRLRALLCISEGFDFHFYIAFVPSSIH